MAQHRKGPGRRRKDNLERNFIIALILVVGGTAFAMYLFFSQFWPH